MPDYNSKVTIMRRLAAAAAERAPLVFAHRGGSAHALENTVEAFAAARAAGADGIECDLQLSGDGSLVVFHDATLERLAGERRRVDAMPLRELRSVGLTADGRRGRIATPDEMVDAVGIGMLLDLEIKSHGARLDRVAARLVEWIRARALAPRVLVSSFDPRAIPAVRRAAGRAGLTLATATIWCDDPEVPRLLRRGLGRTVSGSDAAKPCAAQALRGRGSFRRPALVWTVNDVATAVALSRRAPAALVGDDPGLLLGARGEGLFGADQGSRGAR